MDEHFLALAAAVGAEPGDNGYYRGIVGRAPFLLKKTESDPAGYFFKFRRKNLMEFAAESVGAVWHEQLPADHAAAEIRCDLEEDYVFLWIDRPLELPADALSALAPACVRDHAGLFPEEEGQCMSCHQSGSASLVQANSSIATICPECLEQKRQSNAADNAKLNTSDGHFAAMIPVSLLAGGIAWALFWGLYDAAFRVAKSDMIHVPLMLMVLVAACGLAIGWPIGTVLHRAGASKRSASPSPLGLAVFLTVVIAGLGELMYAAYTAYRMLGGIDFNLVRDLTLPFLFGDNPVYAGTKVGFALMVGTGISEGARRKEKKLAL